MNTADRLTREFTAFGSFREFLKAMKPDGKTQTYVPTIGQRGKAHDKLRRIVRAHDCKVFEQGRVS